MTKRELVLRIAEQVDVSQLDIAKVVQLTLDYIIEALQKGETVEFRNFGVFRVKEHRPRVGRNPKKPTEVVQIPRRRVVKFKAGRVMRKLITAS